ncbi:trypsin-like serine proteinase 1 [Dinothrombium tinctorium]|uniref:Trypsin-like serine proteinase 1 n=1 Tax=Dinothrombium tinctorium TaxID=1965070 RepID=A0A443RBJ3_9ACAR|nr:trypsin-like serine proteinase 1 [Dinothrombium tinctorium]
MFVKDLATLRPRTNSEEFKKHFEPFEKELEINSPPPPPPISQIDDSAVEDVINPPDCGKTKEFLTGGRVVGGRRARNEEFPWQVALMTSRFPQTFGQFTHYCGGTVLNSRWILTAAHCTHNVDLEHLKGMVGTNDIRRPGPKSMEIYFDLSIIHENYTHGEYNNDIALLHTTKSMPMYPNTTAINAACLPQANQAFDGFLTVSGWGRISEEGPRTSRLKTLGVPLQESGNCKQRYKKLFHEDTMLCVVNLEKVESRHFGLGRFLFPSDGYNGGYSNRYNPYGGYGYNPYKPYNPYNTYTPYYGHNSGYGYENRPKNHRRFNRFRNRNYRYLDPYGNPYTTVPTRYRGGRTDELGELTTGGYNNRYRSGDVGLSAKDCGRAPPPPPIGGRIVGGNYTYPRELPWQVSIQVNHLPSSRGDWSQYCGASILNERWLVTAAHCLTGVNLENMKGIIGTDDVKRIGDQAQEVEFDKAITHPDYDESNSRNKYNNDIALLRTKTKIKLTRDFSVNAVCLPKSEEITSGKVTVSGWGRISEGGSKSDKLRKVDVSVQNSDYCKKAYKTLFSDEYFICAGVLEGGKDSCQADSGGPLIQRKNGKAYLVGVVSFGIGCARRGNPGVYAKVSHYVDWIKQTVRENS